jgi:signal transduction histidine kinase
MSSMGAAGCGARCLFAHDFLNKLTAIIGQCDLMDGHLDNPECEMRVRIIRQAAHSMAADINSHRCVTSDLVR